MVNISGPPDFAIIGFSNISKWLIPLAIIIVLLVIFQWIKSIRKRKSEIIVIKKPQQIHK